MGLGNYDLKAKILCVSGKVCLLALAVAQVLAILIILGLSIGLYLEAGKNAFAFVFVVPGAFGFFSAIGAVVLMFVRKQVLAMICLVWPVITIIVTSIICMVFAAVWTEKGKSWTSADAKYDVTTLFFITSLSGFVLIPFAICCIVILCCLGLCKKEGEGGDFSASNGKSQMGGGKAPDKKKKKGP